MCSVTQYERNKFTTDAAYRVCICTVEFHRPSRQSPCQAYDQLHQAQRASADSGPEIFAPGSPLFDLESQRRHQLPTSPSPLCPQYNTTISLHKQLICRKYYQYTNNVPTLRPKAYGVIYAKVGDRDRGAQKAPEVDDRHRQAGRRLDLRV